MVSFLCAAFVLPILPGFAAAQVMYTITDLGTLGGTTSAAYAINGLGQITGISTPAGTSSNFHAFRTTPGGLISSPGADLGTLGGLFSYGYAINATGQFTGLSDTGAFASHAFRTTATGRISDPGTDLGTLGGTNSIGGAINASGQVTGNANLPNDVASHAFRTTATGRISDPGTDLGVFPGGSRSSGGGINDAGQVFGYSEYALPPPPNTLGPTRAFRTTPTGLVTDPGADLGTLGGSVSSASAINSSGQVAGSSKIAGDLQTHAFRSSPNGQPVVLTDLGSLGGNSFGIGIVRRGRGVFGDTARPQYRARVHLRHADARPEFADPTRLRMALVRRI